MTDNDYNTNIEKDDALNKDHIPKEAWDTQDRVDMDTGTNRYHQLQMSDTLLTVNSEVENARETDKPFNSLVILLSRNGTQIESNEYDNGIERFYTQVGDRNNAIDLAVQFAIEASKEFLSDILDNNPKINQEELRTLEKGLGYNIIKRVIDEFNLTDEDIDLNGLKGNLSDAVEITDQEGNKVDL